MEDELSVLLDQQQAVPEENNEEQPTYLSFRLGREEHETDKCNGIVLAFFKVWFCSLGLWGHQAWNYVPRVLVCVVCVFQAGYYLYAVIGCGSFYSCAQNSFRNSTDKGNLTNIRDSPTEDAVYTISSVAALVSYVFFVGCFYVAKGKNSAMVAPSETLMNDLDIKNNLGWLFLAFVLITAVFLYSAAAFYMITWSELTSYRVNMDFFAGVGAQYLAQWAAITSCHVFAVSSLALGTFSQDAYRHIRDIQNGTLDDIIRIHEDLCTIVFNTVSAYSWWFVLHWFTYGADVILSVILTSKELHSKGTAELSYYIMCLLLHLYLFLLPCYFAAKITNFCAGIFEKINCSTSVDWNEGHPFRKRRHITAFVYYAEKRRCCFRIERITFDSYLTWFSFAFGLVGLLSRFF